MILARRDGRALGKEEEVTSKSELAGEHQRMQDELSTRRSTNFFARAAISLVASSIFAGAAVKLFWDSVRLSYLGLGSTVVFAALAWYGVWQYRTGKKWAKEEQEKFVALQTLRRKLSLEDPSDLLPQ
jgi:hypothetical protein